MVELAPMSAWEQMSADYNILGLSPRYHPLLLLRSQLPAELVTTADLFAAHERVHAAMERQRGKQPSGPPRIPSGASGRKLRNGQRISIAGLVVCRQRPSTAKGITFLLLEDEHNLVNVVVYPQLHQRHRLLVRNTPLLIVEGRLQLDGDTVNIVALDFKAIDVQALQGALTEAGFMQEDTMAAAAGAQTLQPKAHNFH
jgi:error-prone DNA polymerase